MYLKVSPFMAANKFNAPILLIHGEADNNSGTFPIQSERLYMALKGTARPSATSHCHWNLTATWPGSPSSTPSGR